MRDGGLLDSASAASAVFISCGAELSFRISILSLFSSKNLSRFAGFLRGCEALLLGPAGAVRGPRGNLVFSGVIIGVSAKLLSLGLRLNKGIPAGARGRMGSQSIFITQQASELTLLMSWCARGVSKRLSSRSVADRGSSA